ncbi:hypothetical protein DL96DRAFT_11978 [Flagelloscypha sp. PMI_526]|nr:hypothetical protein DL96DRAFT_11978 [Flagelloscypha sp. PMI_526]
MLGFLSLTLLDHPTLKLFLLIAHLFLLFIMIFSSAFLALALSSFAFSAPTPIRRQGVVVPASQAEVDQCRADPDACRADPALNASVRLSCESTEGQGGFGACDGIPSLPGSGGSRIDVVVPASQAEVDQCRADPDACRADPALNASVRLSCESTEGQGGFGACDGIPSLPGSGGSKIDVVVPASQAEVDQCRADPDACRADPALNASVRLSCESTEGQGGFGACDGIP